MANKYIDLSGLTRFLEKVKGWVTAQGYQTSEQVEQTIASKGFETTTGAQAKADAAKAAAVAEVKELGYQTSAQVESAITAKGYATASSVDSKVGAAKTELQQKIDAAVASAFTYKGVKATKAELPVEGNKVGDVWHVTADAGEYAWDGTKWEALGGNIDLSAYMLKTDMVAITTDEIDALFA